MINLTHIDINKSQKSDFKNIYYTKSYVVDKLGETPVYLIPIIYIYMIKLII